MSLKSLYWLGIRESEIHEVKELFKGSITIFGSGRCGNLAFDKDKNLRYNYNEDNNEWSEFLQSKILEIIHQDENCQFMAYDNFDFLGFDLEIKEHLICCNDALLTKLLNQKFLTREYVADCATLLPYAILSGRLIKSQELKQLFPDYEEFVVQADFSCGGSGTWLYSDFCDFSEKRYAVSPYLKNSVSLNVHLMIYHQEVIFFPPSVQLISTDDGTFSYQGSDFIMYRYLPEQIKQKLEFQAKEIGNLLRNIGYRGICGIDFLATTDCIYFMEINARFQSSTFLLNRELSKCPQNLSMQLLHIDAFENDTCSFDIPEIVVQESFFHYSFSENSVLQLKMLHGLADKCPEITQCIDDELNWMANLKEHTYLYKLVFNTNIAALSPEYKTVLHPNIAINSSILNTSQWRNELLHLKIMLLHCGVRVDGAIISQMQQNGGLNYLEFEALDLNIDEQFYFNVPYQAKLTELSPFSINLNIYGNYVLMYWNVEITKVNLRSSDPLGENRTVNGFRYAEISYLGNDRLRIYHRNGCYFKTHDIGCQFCDIEKANKSFPFVDIEEVIDAYCGTPQIQHYLIGGGSDTPESDFRRIIEIAKKIKVKTAKPIYLMSIPPKNIEVLKSLKKAGITEVAFNLEVYDRELACRYMPGKGSIPLEVYENAFKQAVSLWGRSGNVRTIFIVGLESRKSLLAGVEYVCKLGVSPILSLFKPIGGTPLSHLLPPSDQEILQICFSVEKLCKLYGVPLGPTCRYCEDNTLKVTY